jgi:hypothetical protein
MNTKQLKHLATAVIGAGFLSLALVGNAVAKNSTSLGNGIKCTWVLVSSVGSTNTYKQVCRKGV